MGFGSPPGHPSTGPGTTGQMRSGSNNVAKPMLSSAKRQYGILLRPDAGEPQCRGSRIKPAKLPNERRDTLAKAVCLPGRPSKSWCWLDEDAEGDRGAADRDRGGHRITRRVDNRYRVVAAVHDIDLAAVRVTATPKGETPTGIVSITVFVAVAMTNTAAEFWSVTYALPPSGVTATLIADVPKGKGIMVITVLVAVSITGTVLGPLLLPWFAT